MFVKQDGMILALKAKETFEEETEIPATIEIVGEPNEGSVSNENAEGSDSARYSYYHTFSVYQRGLDGVKCSAVKDSMFFASKKAWSGLCYDFSITDITMRRLQPLAIKGGALEVYGEVSNDYTGSSAEAL